MSNATDRLRREHRDLSRLLDVLERQLQGLQVGYTPDYSLMRDIFHYLAEYPDRYHHPYEDLILSRLARRVPEKAALVEEYHDEHALLSAYGRQALALAECLLNGSIISRAEMYATGSVYLAEYRAHLEHGEKQIVAVADAHLTQADWLQIDTAFHWRPDPLFGDEVMAEYRALHDRITIETSKRSRDRSGREWCVACALER